MAVLYAAWGALPLPADEGSEVIQAHPMKVYSNAERRHAGDRNQLLTRDAIAVVRRFYETNPQAGDRIEPYQAEGEKGFQVVFHRTIEGKEQSVAELMVTERVPDGTILHPALGELKGLVMKGLHSEDEFKAMEKQYKRLSAAFYRQVDDGEGGLVDEGERIYRQARDQAHAGEKFEVDKTELAEGKAKAKELKKQMKALKAKGDIAGMMKLAQQSRMAPPKVAGEAMQAAAKDTWDIWVGCLRDLKAAAYWTKLQYPDAVLPAGE